MESMADTDIATWVQWGLNALLALGAWGMKSLFTAISDLRKNQAESTGRLNLIESRQADAIESLRRDVATLNERSEANAQKLDTHIQYIIEIHKTLGARHG